MDGNEKYLTTKEACEFFKVSDTTLRYWDKEGKIATVRTAGNHRRYSTHLLEETNNCISSSVEKENICYCRVSSIHQKSDLENQKNYLRKQFPSYRIVQDIASGINWNRKGFKTILELAMQKKLGTVVVTYRDRLCRFSFELIQWILETNGAKLVVLDETISTNEQKLADDLLSIIHVFSCKKMGKRRYKKEECTMLQENITEPNKRTTRCF